jgi:hypothetical protein
MRILIKTNETTVDSGISKAGKPYSIPKQKAYLVDDEMVLPFTVSLGKDQSPFAPGEYELAASSFSVTPWGSLELDRVRLEPRPSAQPIRAAGAK